MISSADALQPAIILVRPQLGENIGKAARAMLNFGLTDLRLVAPRDGWPNPDAGPAASGADIVLANAQVFETLADAVAGLLANRAGWEDRRAKARAFVEAERNWSSNIRRYEPIYQRLLGQA